MPIPQIKSFADKSGKSETEIEKLYNDAKKISSKAGFKEGDDNFYAYTIGILKKMLSLTEDTNSTDIAKPQMKVNNIPCFDVDDDVFFTLHLKKRKFGEWYNKYYKHSEVANYARSNKGKDFFIKHNELGILRRITSN